MRLLNPKQIWAVGGGKGGVGKSLVATNLAAALADEGRAVCLVDLDVTCGDVAILLGLTLRATYTICAASSGDYVAVQFSAAAFGVMSVGAGLGSAVSPTVGGAISDNLSLIWTFAVASIGSAVGMAGSLVMIKNPRSPERAPQSLPN